jgi:imidazolonepropionase-like amidohydrolase
MVAAAKIKNKNTTDYTDFTGKRLHNPGQTAGLRSRERERDVLCATRSLTVAALSFLMLASLAAAQTTVAIKGGTVLTMTGPAIKNGTVLIRDGKITAVGAGVAIPAGAKVVDATGKYVMPGLVDAMCYYGIAPADRNDTGNPVTPENRIIYAYFPFGDFMRMKSGEPRDRELLSGGVTTIYVAPGNHQVIGGQGAVVKITGKNTDSAVLREPASIDMTISDATRYDPRGGKSPSTRMAVVSLIRKALVNAQQYQRDAEAKKDETKRDLGAEALGRMLRKELPARVEADLVDDIRTAMRITEEFGLALVIDSGVGAYRVKETLAEKKIPVVLGPISHSFVSGDETAANRLAPEVANLASEENAVLLAKAGVKFALASFGYGYGLPGSAYQGRWLLLNAALNTGFGLSEDEALKAITINPAEILGVANRVGSLAQGKDADVVILSGPPLGLKTWVEQVFIDGTLVYTR